MKIRWSVLVLALCILAGVFLEVYRIGSSPLQEWDEARRGINAIGMIRSGDYLTYRFLDDVDTFVSKPPLATWLISINFKLFGYNLAALRLHSVIATLLFFLCAIRLVRLYKDAWFAAMVLAILVTVKGVIGFHVGRNGDTDSLLLLFLTAAAFHFLRYWDFGDRRSIYFALIFAGLGFYAKGLAILLFLPGIAAIIALSWDHKKLFNRHVLFSLLIFLGIVMSWYILSLSGNRNVPDAAGSISLWQGMWQTDGLTRFTDPSFERGYDPWYLFTILDTRFNVWNYLLYAGIAFWIIRAVPKRESGETRQTDRLLVVSALLAGGMALALVASSNKHSWYFAPGYLFLAIITASFTELLVRRKRWAALVFALLVCALFARRVAEISHEQAPMDDFFREHAPALQQADRLLIRGEVPQHYILSFILHNPDKSGRAEKVRAGEQDGVTILLSADPVPGEVLGTIDGFFLIRKN